MRKRRTFTAALVLLLVCAPLCLAQNNDGRQQQPPRTTGEEGGRRREQRKTQESQQAEQNRPGGLVTAELPKGEGAWVVQIVTGGGIMGVGRGNLTVTSDGVVTCAPASPNCPQALTPEAVRPLAEAVAAARTKSWRGKSTDVCHDCYFTTMMLQRREPEHGARTYLFSWDDLAAGEMPDDVRRVYETALAVAAKQ